MDRRATCPGSPGVGVRNGKGEIGMTRSYVSGWLWGKRGISVRYAEILAGVFRVPASQFVDSRTLLAQADWRRLPTREKASCYARTSAGSLELAAWLSRFRGSFRFPTHPIRRR